MLKREYCTIIDSRVSRANHAKQCTRAVPSAKIEREGRGKEERHIKEQHQEIKRGRQIKRTNGQHQTAETARAAARVKRQRIPRHGLQHGRAGGNQSRDLRDAQRRGNPMQQQRRNADLSACTGGYQLSHRMEDFGVRSCASKLEQTRTKMLDLREEHKNRHLNLLE
jgi:hypothetical protein